MKLTDEQAEIMDVGRTGAHLAIEAYAGTGKTTVLELLAKDRDRHRMTYTARNRDIVKDGKLRFPGNVRCSTQHGLAFGPYGSKMKHRLDDRQKIRPSQMAEILKTEGIEVQGPAGRKRLSASWFASMAYKTVTSFCQTGDPIMRRHHVAWSPGMVPDSPVPKHLDPWFDIRQQVGPLILDYARAAWQDLLHKDGLLEYQHDHYLKAWQLSEPVIRTDVILYDEAQDASGVMLAIVEAQRDHAQVIYVGDRHQSIYSWAGAVNAMSNVNVDETRYLTGSFRFGPGIAEQANRLLVGELGAPTPVQGLSSTPSRIGPGGQPDVTLCRSNSGIIGNVIDDLTRGLKPGVVGGTKDIIAFAMGARDLQEGGTTTHPDLSWADTWEEVLTYAAEDPMGDDLATVVKIVEQHSARTIIDMLYQCQPEESASVLYSTGHKAKGREWDHVRLHGDYPEPVRDPLTGELENGEEMRLIYVALTRAQQQLDHSRVDWLNGRGLHVGLPLRGTVSK